MLRFLKKGLLLICFSCMLLPILKAQSGNLDDIKNQSIDPGENFDTIDISAFILPGVNCANIQFSTLREKGTDTRPSTDCEKTKAYHSTMNARIIISYGLVETFNHEDDYVIFYNEKEEVIECGGIELMRNDVLLNEPTYALSLNGGSQTSTVKMEFYSGKDERLYIVDSVFQYVQNDRMGLIGAPYVIDLAPLSMAFDGAKNVAPLVKDTSFTGTICYTVTVTDCDNGQTGTDEICLSVGVEEDLCQDDYSVTAEIFTTQEYFAAKTIEAVSVLQPSAKVLFKAGESITLKPGFAVKAGADFLAMIEDCSLPPEENFEGTPTAPDQAAIAPTNVGSSSANTPLLPDPFSLKIIPNPAQAQAKIWYHLTEKEPAFLQVMDANGRVIQQQKTVGTTNGGWQYQTIETTALPSGIYFVTLSTAQKSIHHKMLVP